MTTGPKALQHALLLGCGVAHGFGVRGVRGPDGLVKPRQVHGAAVAEVCANGRLEPEEADAVVTTRAGLSVAVVTADCVPILACSDDASAVAAIHAGWRGLAQGVVTAGIAALRRCAKPGVRLVAALGPHIGACCYEVDAPVIDSLRVRFGEQLERALEPTRPGYGRLDLGGLVRSALRESGIDDDSQGGLEDTCTGCDAERFHSYRRDGPSAGRLVHFVAAGVPSASPSRK